MSELAVPQVNDGYQWRKYGQKLGKGMGAQMCCYFRCATPDCPCKRQIFFTPGGVPEVRYKDAHNHARPFHTHEHVTLDTFADAARRFSCYTLADGTRVNGNLMPPLTTEEDDPTLRPCNERSVKFTVATTQAELASTLNETITPDQLIGGMCDRHPQLRDGAQWKKYGQKHTKSCNKAYFRCVHPDCPARRSVSAPLGQGENVSLQFFYDGVHNHPVDSASAASALSPGDSYFDSLPGLVPSATGGSASIGMMPGVVGPSVGAASGAFSPLIDTSYQTSSFTFPSFNSSFQSPFTFPNSFMNSAPPSWRDNEDRPSQEAVSLMQSIITDIASEIYVIDPIQAANSIVSSLPLL